ncbi:hypothetical protein [Luxibacter massiliensis]|uniref:hypothetical protein n=1 Tax=Luxibacter massiliensis TaxID=2219695 RepID=UPI000F06962F|nr:hypothetical protein [Luxibacter massiliensis]
MSENQEIKKDSSKEKRNKKNVISIYLVAGMCIGILLGVAVESSGIIVRGVGIGVGLAIGTGVGFAIGQHFANKE